MVKLRTENTDDNIHGLRMPPHSIEAEQMVLGGCMISADAADIVMDILSEKDFYRHDHRIIYKSICHLATEDKPRDVVTMAEHLKSIDELEQAGGMSHICLLAGDTPSAANIEAHANIVRDKSILRQLITESDTTTSIALDPKDRPVSEIIDDAQSRLMVITETESTGPRHIKQIISDTLAHLDERTTTDFVPGLPTGFSDIDRKLIGLQNSDLVIIAGRPSMGKTAIAMNIVEHVCVDQQVPTLVFSMEMSADQLEQRLISSMCGIELEKIRTGNGLEQSDFTKITECTSKQSAAPLYIDERASLNITQIRSTARRWKKSNGLGLIVLDYLQLMSSYKKTENRHHEISEISRGLKALAKELNIPVIALSQLNRSLEQRGDKRPIMSDLRESGSIEQDADIIAFMYRDVVYHENTQEPLTAEFIIRKHRNGSIGTVYLNTELQHCKFRNRINQKVPIYKDAPKRNYKEGMD